MKFVVASALLCSSILMAQHTNAWATPSGSSTRPSTTAVLAQPAGSFFNPVPEDSNDGNKPNNNESSLPLEDDNLPFYAPSSDSFEADLMKMLRKRNAPSLASQPSTINGKPTSGKGFSSANASASKTAKEAKTPYIGIGPPSLNDPTKPEYDDQGYTLYVDERTGKKSRVFEALVQYPCDFTLKIVGANEGSFVAEMVAVVAESCSVSIEQVPHSTRVLGKWMSVTLQAPVQSAEMLYQLYENVDRDPRVRFKF